MGRALMTRLLEPAPSADYIGGVELVQRASLEPPEISWSRRAHLPG